jgi:hypothetical protein
MNVQIGNVKAVSHPCPSDRGWHVALVPDPPEPETNEEDPK